MRLGVKLAGVLVAFILSFNCVGQAAERDPGAVKEQFNEIFSRVDTGGDLLLVANVSGIFEDFMDQMVAFISASATTDEDVKKAGDIAGRLADFFKKNGFYAARGVGLSMVPRNDGLNDIKMFLARNPEAMNLAFWQGVVGGAPGKQACQAFLPADTVMARVGTADLKQLWKLVRTAMAEVAPPEAAASFEESLAMASMMMGIGVDELVNSFGEAGFMSIQLSKDATVNIPVGKDFIEMPSPSVLMCLAVKDDTLSKLLDTKLSGPEGAESPVPVVKETINGVTVNSISIPIPSPIPVEPTFAQKDGFFIFGSTKKAVVDALNASSSGNGLTATPEFKKHFANLPAENNGLIFFDKRLSSVITDVQTRMWEANAAETGVDFSSLNDLFGAGIDQVCAMVIVNEPNGILVTGVSSSGGRELVLGTTMAPAGLLAAIAIPSFVRARTVSQQNACINNLRMIEAAKDQWALEEGKTNGTSVTEEDIAEYLPYGMPVCPAGGVYTIGVVGSNATCSEFGHVLP